MDDSPHDFLLNHRSNDLKQFKNYKHRTFNETDALYFVEFLSQFYRKYDSLEKAFAISETDDHTGNGLINFHNPVF